MKPDKITTKEFNNFQEAANALAIKDVSLFTETFGICYNEYDKFIVKIEEKEDKGEFISCVVTIEVYNNFFASNEKVS